MQHIVEHLRHRGKFEGRRGLHARHQHDADQHRRSDHARGREILEVYGIDARRGIHLLHAGADRLVLADRADDVVKTDRTQPVFGELRNPAANDVSDEHDQRRAKHIGDGCGDALQHPGRGNRDRVDPQRVQRLNGDGNHDQGENQDADEPRKAGAARHVREAGIDQPAVDLRGLGRRLHHTPGDGCEGKADEEDQHRAYDVGHISDEALDHGVERLRHRRETRKHILDFLDRRDKADQPDHPIADFADPFADVDGRLLAAGSGAVAARQEGQPVYPLGDRPFHALGDEMSRDQNERRAGDIVPIFAHPSARLGQIEIDIHERPPPLGLLWLLVKPKSFWNQSVCAH